MLSSPTMRFFYIICTFTLFSICWHYGFAQEMPLNNRVTLVKGDTILSFTLQTSSKKVPTEDSKIYTWYYRNNLGIAQGAYEGKLIHGAFSSMLRNNKLLEKGNYVKGLKSGEWKLWHKNGNTHYIEHWKKGERQGQYLEYDSQGNLVVELIYRQGELHGREKRYRINGQRNLLQIERSWRHGKLRGKFAEYDSSEHIKRKGKFYDSLLHGKIITYQLLPGNLHSIEQKLTYRKGMLHGQFLEKYGSGHLKRKGKYKKGILYGRVLTNDMIGTQYTTKIYHWRNEQYHGPFKEFNTEGKLVKKGGYKKGLLHGKLVSWDAEGNKIVQYYKEGQPREKEKLREKFSKIKQKIHIKRRNNYQEPEKNEKKDS